MNAPRPARKAPKIDHGKKFEKLVHDAARHLPEKYPILWERVIDSHDAGNLVRAADCDFKLVIRAGPPSEEQLGRPWLYHIECKASTKYNSLADKGAVKALMKPGQIAKLRIARRAGVGGMVWFHSVSRGLIEVWNAVKVTEAYLEGVALESPSAVLRDDCLVEGLENFIEGHNENPIDN